MRDFTLLLIFVLFSPIIQAQHDDPLAQIRFLLINKKFEDLLIVTDSLELPESVEAEIYYYRGTAFRELSRYDSALYYFQQALERDSTNLSYKITLGKAYQSFGWIREAIFVFEEVIREDSLDRKSRLDLAALYMIRKEYIKSLELYQHLLERDSLNYFLSKQAGICFLETGQQDSALYYFEQAFFLNPADVYLTQQIANIFLGKEKLDKALLTVQKGIVHDTSHADLLSLRGYLWYLNNNLILAIKDLEASASQYSSSVFTYKYLAGKNADPRPDNFKDPDSERLLEIVQSRINYLKESLHIEE